MRSDALRIRDEDLSWRQVGDEVIVLDLRSNSYLSINESGTALWQMLVDGSTPEGMTARLTTDYGLDQDTAQSDVDAFVAMLTDLGLLG
jgi:Coenzyme PQQ synthesis protein D (PqqD)